MERKRFLFKNIFYIFCTLMIAGAGLLFVQAPEAASAMDTSTTGELGEQSLKARPFFLRQDFVTGEEDDEVEYGNSLLEYDSFVYSNVDDNSLRLSFLLNGGENGTYNSQDIFNFVYYPDLADRTTFQFFSVTNMNLFINGELQKIEESKYISTQQELKFENASQNVESFEIVFDKDGSGEHSFSLFKDDKIVEGVYTLSLTYIIFTTHNGTDALNNITFPGEQVVTETYSFYVTDRANYLTNNRPKLQKGAFDHVIEVENALQSPDAFMLYSNYSSKAAYATGQKDGVATESDKIPYVEFDYLRFEADVLKDYASVVSSTSLRLNMDAINGADEAVVVAEGDTDIMGLKLDKSHHLARLYFTDLGVYSISLNPIEVVQFETAAPQEPSAKIWQKYELEGLATITKMVRVHLFGYQLHHTDFDQPTDANNVRPTKEMKDFDFENGSFLDGADITSKYLRSKEYFQENASSAFTRSNIFDFINTHAADCKCGGGSCAQQSGLDATSDIKYALTPVKTNQTPLRFYANATQFSDNVVRSTVYSTVQVDSSYSKVDSINLQGETFYECDFDGIVENTPGKYIYVMRYRYNNFNRAENTPGSSQLFCQIFFFEIDKTVPDVEISFTDADGVKQLVSKNKFLNSDVTIVDITKNDRYNKDVTVQVYAWDYAEDRWFDGFTAGGISLQDLPKKNDDTDQRHTFKAAENARYTVRLYYTSEITPEKLDYENGSGFFRERTFTIDSNPIANVTARNFQQTTSPSKYTYHSTLEGDAFSTNQPIAFSWDEKASGATTWAYYRYFPLQTGSLGTYYPSNNNEKIGNLLTYMVSANLLPVNAILDLRTNGSTSTTTDLRNWLPYAGNTKSLNESSLDKQYVLSDAGLYFLDVYDIAGNHKIELFLIDNTAPIFAIHNSSGYSLPTTPFIDSATTLYWTQNKGIFIAGLDNTLFTNEIYADNPPTAEDLESDFYKTQSGETSVEIYSLLKDLMNSSYIKDLSPNINKLDDDGTSQLLMNSYNGLYLAIPIDSTSYYMDGTDYLPQQDVYSKTFSEPLEEMTYTVLIRDKSNTKRYLQWDAHAQQQYTSYCSAQQTIIISFDTSKFFVQYEKTDGSVQYMTTNNSEADKENSSLLTYLNPTNMSRPLQLTFRPTDPQNNKIQVETVTMKYAPFKAFSKDISSGEQTTRYWYYGFEELSSPQELYRFEGMQDSGTQLIDIKVSASSGFTEPGKYVFTRTYKMDEGYSHNDRDYVTRTYVLIVDRNEVISNQQLVTDTAGKRHNEDLVGGDIFVAMYDSGNNSNLVVTFPNSENSNSNGVMLYSNNLTTNKLPVKLYVPQFKYTTHVQKIETTTGYRFEVRYDFATDNITIVDENGDPIQVDGGNGEMIDKTTKDTMNYFNAQKQNLIREYALFAAIYKDVDPAVTPTATPIAVTSTSPSNPTFASVQAAANENGFLNFYNYSTGSKVEMLYQPGTYYVRLEQGTFGTSTAMEENSFASVMDFHFVIEQSTPNFDVTTTNGQALNFEAASSTTPLTYLTNQAKLNITWQESRNEYMANIDVTHIAITTPQESFVYNLKDDTYHSASGSTLSHSNIWDSKPNSNNYVYSGVLNLQELGGVYQNGGYVDITMQFENHDIAKDENGRNLYSTIRKRIKIDLCAPSDNVERLVDIALQDNPISVLTRENLRIYRTAINETTTTDLANTSYNISNGSDQNIFAYFSYSVAPNFLQTLVASQDDSVAYVRKLKAGEVDTKYTSDIKETSPSDFNANEFDLAAELVAFEGNTYYEVVEMDKARNMSIYTIFVTDPTQEQNLITYADENGDGTHHYTTSDFNRVLEHPNAIHNIFSRTGFQLRDINYFGDEWARMRLTTFSRTAQGNITSRTVNLMMTPYDTSNVYMFSTDGSAPQKVAISSLIDGEQSIAQKHRLEIYDRVSQSFTTFYFNIYNAPLSPMPTSTSRQEMLSFINVTDQMLQSTEMAQQPFVTSMKITIDGRVIYSDGVLDDVPQSVQNPLGYASLWKNFTTSPANAWQQEEIVRVYVSGNQLFFEINPNYSLSSRNSRVIYEFTDNYGISYTETHIFRESVISQEITSVDEINDPLYAYYDQASVKLVYILSRGIQYHFNANKYHVEYREIVPNGEGFDRLPPNEDKPLNVALTNQSTSSGVTTWTFQTTRASGQQYHDRFVLELYDQQEFLDKNSSIEGLSVKKEIYFDLFNQLPEEEMTNESNQPAAGKFKLLDVNGNIIDCATLVNGSQGYYSQILIRFTLLDEAETFIPVKYMYRTEDTDWQELTSGTRLQNRTDQLQTYYLKIWYDEQYLHNELGNGAYVFENVPQSNIFQFSLSSLTSNYWVEKTENGVTSVVQKAEHGFRSQDGKSQYTNHYIVNVPKEDVAIKVNNEQNIVGYEKPIQTWEYNVNDQQIVSERYLLTNRNSIGPNVSMFEANIVITYIPSEENFLTSFFTLDTNGTINTNENMVNALDTAQKMLVVQKDLDMDRTQLIWSKYFVIPENEIQIHISLGGKELSPVVYSKTVNGEQCNYIYLTYSGLYTIQFTDTAGNIQKFANKDVNGNLVSEVTNFEFIFLKDVPFTVTYTNPETGEQETALPVKQAIYNNSVTLNIDSSTLRRFYRADGYPTFLDTDIDPETGERKWLIKRNGVEYRKDFESTTHFTFDEPGYYEIAFASVSNLPTVESIRQETYQFTILSSDEHKFSHVFNRYANYYVEKVIKNGQDVTAELLESFKADIPTMTVSTTVPVLDSNGLPTYDTRGNQIFQTITKEYLTQLPLSYADDKTGIGEYIITINTSNNLDVSQNVPHSFTYKVTINSGDAPLRISLAEGESTTGTITINYNLTNLFLEMGESTLRVLRLADNGYAIHSSVDINSTTTGEGSLSISSTGTYFIQLLSPSGNLLFTYKVVRNEPLNTAAIIAIVVAAVVLVAVIFIIIKLRKRISVK